MQAAERQDVKSKRPFQLPESTSDPFAYGACGRGKITTPALQTKASPDTKRAGHWCLLVLNL